MTRRIPARPAAGAALLLALGQVSAAAAATGRPFSGAFRPVEAAHYALTPSSEEFYTEEYELLAWNEAGDRIVVTFGVSNLGFGDGRAMVAVKVDRKGARSVRGETKFGSGDWSHRPDPFRMRLGPSVLSGGPGRLRAVVSVGEVALDLTFDNVLPPWRPGNGRALYDDSGDKYYDLTLLAPRARVTGTVTVRGRRTAFAGEGYADHRAMNVPPNVAGRRWVRFRAFDGDWTLILQELHFPKDLGGGRSPYLLVGYKDRVVFQSLGYRVKFGRVGRDRDPETPYIYPHSMTVESTVGDRRFEVAIRGRKMRRRDLLAGLGHLERALLSKLVRPVGYYFDADWDLSITAGGGQRWEASGPGSYYIKHITP